MPKRYRYIKDGEIIAEVDNKDFSGVRDIEPVEVWVCPDQVTLWQLRAVLRAAGYFPAIIEALNSLPEPTKAVALEAWEYANNIVRKSPTVIFLQMALGLTDEQTDNLFIEAEKLDA